MFIWIYRIATAFSLDPAAGRFSVTLGRQPCKAAYYLSSTDEIAPIINGLLTVSLKEKRNRRVALLRVHVWVRWCSWFKLTFGVSDVQPSTGGTILVLRSQSLKNYGPALKCKPQL